MNKQPFSEVGVPVLIMTAGVGWLLTAQGVGPGIQWVWTLGLAVTGLLFLYGGIDKVSVVAGPLLVAGGILSTLRQADQITIDTEAAVLTILLGALLLLARVRSIPMPGWLTDNDETKGRSEEKVKERDAE